MEQIIDSHLGLAEHQLDDLLSRIDESEFDPTFSDLFPLSVQSDCTHVLEPSTNNKPNQSCSSCIILNSDEQHEETKADSVPKNMMRNTAWAISSGVHIISSPTHQDIVNGQCTFTLQTTGSFTIG